MTYCVVSMFMCLCAYVFLRSVCFLTFRSVAIKKENKMTKEQFVRNNRGINNGKNLPQEYLEALYDGIVNNEITMDHEREDMREW